jgi:uncharacterized SAM-binding protein YcdF (DUF218 family)
MSWLLAAVAAAILVVRSWMLWRTRADRTRRWWFGWAVPVVAALVLVAELAGGALELSKLVAMLLLPAGLVWVALIALVVAAAAQGRRRSALALAAVFVAYTLAGNVWVGAALMASLERGFPPIDPTALPPVDVVVVLGGGTDLGPDRRPQLGPSGDRILTALQLWQAKRAPVLATTGSAIRGFDRTHDDAFETAALWRSLGVPDEAIVPLPGPRTTSEEILCIREEAGRRGWKRIALVTSAWHMPRALRLCARAGLEVVPVPCDYRSGAPPFNITWLIPHERGFRAVHLACWEMLGRLAGR